MREKSKPTTWRERKQLSEEHKRRIREGLARRAQAMSVAGAILSEPPTADPVPSIFDSSQSPDTLDSLRRGMSEKARAMISLGEEILRLLGDD
jgi:hypothetical protein